MSKTYLQWFDELPEPYRTQAKTNLIPFQKRHKTGSIHLAIKGGFIWDSTQEGWNYWNDLVEQLNSNPK